MTARWVIPAFSGYGIELEYAIVDRVTLEVLPLAAESLRRLKLPPAVEDARSLAWSNELVAHVIELKNAAPAPALEALSAQFSGEVRRANRVLESIGARLMPTAMHPWMDPLTQTVLWADDPGDIYRTYDRIFDCRAHGWSNIQSMHVNLPFADDRQFERLHAAIRIVLPLLPALGASSPVAEAHATGSLDYRLHVYAANSVRVPALTGQVVPERVSSRSEYEATILEPMYREIAPLDPAGALRYEWLNSRGAIARFDRNAIEIRVIDLQECPRADVAIAGAAVAVVEALYEERWSLLQRQQQIETEALAAVLRSVARAADQAVIEDRALLGVLGIEATRCSAADAWRHLVGDLAREAETVPWWLDTIAFILDRGPLARRIMRSLDGDLSRERLRETYARICDCLDRGELFG